VKALALQLPAEQARIQPGITAVNPLEFTSYPFSHSLAALSVWAALSATTYWLVRRSARGAVVVGLVALSHWVLDAVAHRPDLPLYPGGHARVGLGLWHSVPATLLVEGGLFALGLVVYLRATTARDRVGRLGLWALVAFLAVTYLASVFGPPPPSIEAVAWVGEAGLLLVPWGY
jgi:hypothetical protein